VKILVLTNLFPTPWDPRRGTFNRQQFERLGERHEVDVLTAVDFRERMAGARGQVHVPHVKRDHFTFYHPPGIGRFLNALCYVACVMWQRGRELRRARYDVILASWAYPDGAAAAWISQLLGVPYVVKVHGSDLNVQASSRLRRLQIRHAFRGAGAVLTVSKALAAKAIEIGARPDAVETVYNGVDGRVFRRGHRAAARERLGLPLDAPIILYAGNLKVSKGCMDLIDAFPLLAKQRRDARLYFVGDGPDASALESRSASLCCGSSVHFMDAVAHAALADWFRAADLLCLPSHNEGVPNVVLEAMACGTPVVATAVGGIPEVVPAFAGLLVPAHHPELLAGALAEMLGRHVDSEAIAAHAASFRWDDNIDRLEHMLERVAAGAPANVSVNV
jgi:glycosyltransferase involved in cell wall biosynthesis